jgi:hypothetical protein
MIDPNCPSRHPREDAQTAAANDRGERNKKNARNTE